MRRIVLATVAGGLLALAAPPLRAAIVEFERPSCVAMRSVAGLDWSCMPRGEGGRPEFAGGRGNLGMARFDYDTNETRGVIYLEPSACLALAGELRPAKTVAAPRRLANDAWWPFEPGQVLTPLTDAAGTMSVVADCAQGALYFWN